jgi:hypothetical protein
MGIFNAKARRRKDAGKKKLLTEGNEGNEENQE